MKGTISRRRDERPPARRVSVGAVLLLLLAQTGQAQYDEPREFTLLETRFVAAGVLDREFLPRSGNTGPDAIAIRYRNYMPVISFHHSAFTVAFGYTRYNRDGGSREGVYFGVMAANDLPVASGRIHALSFPISVGADFTKAQAGALRRDDFNIASLGIGTGIRYQYRGRAVDGAVRALGLVHYSFEGLSSGSGSSFAVDADAHLAFKAVHIGEGIVVGYRFRYQQWSMADGRFDYRTSHHGPYLGVLF